MGSGNEFFTEWTESFDSFDQMGLHENLLRGIYAYGGWPAEPIPGTHFGCCSSQLLACALPVATQQRAWMQTLHRKVA